MKINELYSANMECMELMGDLNGDNGLNEQILLRWQIAYYLQIVMNFKMDVQVT